MVSLAATMYVINTVIPLAVILSVIGALNKLPILNIIGQGLLGLGILSIIATVVYGYVYKSKTPQEKKEGQATNEEEQRRYVMEHLKELLEEEIYEAGVRLAKGKLAEEEGLNDAASVLREVAIDEARHATLIARLIPQDVFKGTKSNVMGAIDADLGAAEREKDFARAATTAGMEEAAKLFEQLSVDEMEHVRKLREIVSKLRGTEGGSQEVE
jgi:rubrerythrin